MTKTSSQPCTMLFGIKITKFGVQTYDAVELPSVQKGGKELTAESLLLGNFDMFQQAGNALINDVAALPSFKDLECKITYAERMFTALNYN